MFKNFHKFILIGIVFTIILGCILHFVYEWSGNNSFVGLICPVNESTVEHLKLLYFPMLVWVVIGYYIFARKNRSYFPAAFVGLVCGLISIPVLFYSYINFTQNSILAVDIAIFVISVILAYVVFDYLFLNYNIQTFSVATGVLLWEFVFVAFTAYYLFL